MACQADCVVFNQMVFVPNQKWLALLDKKKNRHACMCPSPSNLMAVRDIKRVQEVIAREQAARLYPLQPRGGSEQRHRHAETTNHLENSSFSRMGIPHQQAGYNQLELFVNSFPATAMA